MNEHDQDRLKKLLQQALPPVEGDAGAWAATFGPQCCGGWTQTLPRSPRNRLGLVRRGACWPASWFFAAFFPASIPGASLLPVNPRTHIRPQKKQGGSYEHPSVSSRLPGGIFVPTLVLPLLLTVSSWCESCSSAGSHRAGHDLSHGRGAFALRPVEYALALASHERTHLPIGLHGAILPFF
jgi:hypothetical protein